MKRFRAVLVDDQTSCLDVLESIILEEGSIEIVGKAQNVQDGLKLIQSEQPDVVFLDVEMGPETGFDLLDQLNDRDIKVVFSTSHDHYAIKAISYRAFFFLLKPVDSDEFAELIEKLDKESNDDLSKKIDLLLENLKTPNSPDRLALKTLKGYSFFHHDDIVYFKSDDNYCRLVHENGKAIHISMNMKSLESVLDTSAFLRIHRGTLVNKSKVLTFMKDDGGLVEMSNGEKLAVSRRKLDEVVSNLF